MSLDNLSQLGLLYLNCDRHEDTKKAFSLCAKMAAELIDWATDDEIEKLLHDYNDALLGACELLCALVDEHNRTDLTDDGTTYADYYGGMRFSPTAIRYRLIKAFLFDANTLH